MDYSDIVTALGLLLVVPITDPASATPSSNDDFNSILPFILQGGEDRIYREIDFLAQRDENVSITLSTTSRRATLPTDIIVLQGGNVITPAATDPDDGTRNPLQLVSKDFIDQVWPQELQSKDVPQYMAQLNATTVIVAPTADATYKLELTGIFKPEPLSASNTETYITENYPDLMLYSCMVIGTGYQRDFGAQSDDPKMALSWEFMYQTAKKSVLEEDQRRKTQSTNWSPFSPAPLSTPQRP